MAQRAPSQREVVSEEAARWVTILSGPDSTPADHAAFEAWRADNPAHEAAYEREAAAWEALDRLRTLQPAGCAPDADLLAPNQKRPPRRTFRCFSARPRMAAALVGIIVTTAIATPLALSVTASPAYATALGERRIVMLKDGSRIELNTSSKVVVRYSRGARHVWLVEGEALFQIAHDARPFVVSVDDARLQAQDGEVSVRRKGNGAQVLVVSGAVTAETAKAPPSALASGAEATVRADGAESRPASELRIRQALAWRQGAVALNGETLAQAAAEFNRYNRTRIVVTDPAIADLRLAGYFEADDPEGFAEAMTRTFPVVSRRGADGAIVLSRPR